MRPNQVSIVLTAIDQASSVLAQARRSVTDLDGSAAHATRGGLGGLLGGLKGLINPATLAAGAIGAISIATVAAVNTAARFETMLSNVATLGTHTTAEMERLRSGVLELAPAVGESAAQLTGALYDIVSAGFANADALTVLEASAQAARAGLTTTKTAADAVTTAINAYGMAASDASRVTDIIQVAVQRGKTTWDEMGRSLGQVIPLASTAGVSFEELNAAVATATAVGINTNQAITGLRAAIANILQPSAQARDLAANLGISFNAAALEAGGLTGILEQVRTATGGNTEQMSMLFGSVEALNTVLALTSDEGMARFVEGQEAMRDSAGATQGAFEQQMSTVEASRAQFTAALESLNISLGTLFLPIIADATRAMAEFLGWIVQLFDQTTRLEQAQRDLAEATQTFATGATTTAGAVTALTNATGDEGLTAAVTTLSGLLEGEAREAFEQFAGQAIASGQDVTQTAADIVAAFANMRIALLQVEREAAAARVRAAEAARDQAAAPLEALERRRAEVEEQIARLSAALDDPRYAHEVGDIRSVLGRLRFELATQLTPPGHAMRDAQERVRGLNAELQIALNHLAAIDQQEGELALLARDPAAWLARTPPPPPPPSPPPTPDPETTREAAEEIVGLIANAEVALAHAREQMRRAETEADTRYWALRVETAQQALRRLQELHEIPPFVPGLRMPDSPMPTLPGIQPDRFIAPLGPVGNMREIEAARQGLARLTATAEVFGAAWRQIVEQAEPGRLVNTVRALYRVALTTAGAVDQQRAETQAAAQQSIDRLTAAGDALSLAWQAGVVVALRAAREEASQLAEVRVIDPAAVEHVTDLENALRSVQIAIQAGVTPAARDLQVLLQHGIATELPAGVQQAVGSITDLEDALRRVQIAIQAGVNPAARDLQLLTEYGIVAGLPDNVEDAEELEEALKRTVATIDGVARVATAASNALGLGLGGAINAVQGLLTSIVTGDKFGIIAGGINLLSELFSGLSDGAAEVNRQIEELADTSDYLSETLIRQLAVTRRVPQGGIWGWLGLTKEALDEEATRAALEIGNSIADAIARGIRDGGEALQAAIDDILLQAAIESAIMDQAVQALIGAWVAAFQAGDMAEMERLREQLGRTVEDIRRGLIDAGLLEDTPATTPTTRGGGVQISEITGPTRDLFADLMSPLIELPVHTMLLRDIRDLLALPRAMPAPTLATIGTLNINIHGGDPTSIGRRVIELIESKFRLDRRGVGR